MQSRDTVCASAISEGTKLLMTHLIAPRQLGCQTIVILVQSTSLEQDVHVRLKGTGRYTLQPPVDPHVLSD